MRIGIACPYTWDVPGGVQAHIRDLAEALLRLGHEVSVITPADDEGALLGAGSGCRILASMKGIGPQSSRLASGVGHIHIIDQFEISSFVLFGFVSFINHQYFIFFFL